MDTDFLAQEVLRSVDGDLEAFSHMLKQSRELRSDLRNSLPTLVLTKEAVLRVLLRLQKDPGLEALVQKWASFVRRGYITDETRSFAVIQASIEYDPRHEDQIADAVARLDEVGDLVDGEITVEELAQMIHNLSHAA